LNLPPSPPFTVPNDIGPFARAALRKSRLLDLLELNKADFVDFAGIEYSIVVSLYPASFSSGKIDGYSTFCALFAAGVFAGGRTGRPSVDKDGKLLNIFGTAIAATSEPKLSFQDMYGHEGRDKHWVPWNLCLDLVRLVAIEGFKQGIHIWTQSSVALAEKRLFGLRNGDRELQMVEGTSPFGKRL
jgi:hypothetical protein